jgi:hypothetical protein
LTISDAAGRPLSRYRRIQRVVPPELIQQTTTTTGPFNPEQAKSR